MFKRYDDYWLQVVSETQITGLNLGSLSNDATNTTGTISDIPVKLRDELIKKVENQLSVRNQEFNMINLQPLLNDIAIENGLENGAIEGLITDQQILDFYQQHRDDINQVILQIGYLNQTPTNLNISDLDDYKITGIRLALKRSLVKVIEDILTQDLKTTI